MTLPSSISGTVKVTLTSLGLGLFRTMTSTTTPASAMGPKISKGCL